MNLSSKQTERHPVSPETRAKIAAALRGRKHTAEAKANMSIAQSGERGNSWKGDEIGYHGAHVRHRKVLPNACAYADESCKGLLECALSHDTPAEFVKLDPVRGSRYSIRSEDYLRLCTSHHARYDGRKALVAKSHCKHGHEFTPENTGITRNGGRECRACKRRRCAEYRQRCVSPTTKERSPCR